MMDHLRRFIRGAGPYPLSARTLIFFAVCYAIPWGFCTAVSWWFGVSWQSLSPGSTRPDVVILATAIGWLGLAGLDLSLRRFPWGRDKPKQPQERPASLGWPYGQLGPLDPPAEIPARRGFLTGLLVGWWVYCLAAQPLLTTEPGAVFAAAV